MSSLSRCLKKIGLAEHESAILKGAVRDHLSDGYDAHKAATQAVQDYISDLNEERDGYVKQIEDQIGEVKVKAAEDVEEAHAKSAPDSHVALFERVNDGDVTVEEFKAAFESVLNGKEAITAELNALTKAKIFEKFPRLEYRYKNEKKADVARAAYHEMLTDFTLRDTLQYGMGKGEMEKAIQKIVDRMTDESLAEFAAKVKKRTEERAAEREVALAGIGDPQTLEDYGRLMGVKMRGDEKMTFGEARMTLTPEQRATFDSLAAEKTRGERANRKEVQRDQFIRAPGETVATTEIIKTKHTRDGHDLWQFQFEERVSPEEFRTMTAQARTLGGNYSSYRGNGAIPGWQFRTEEAAKAFKSMVAGDATAAKEIAQERRNAFADDKSQSAAERLTEMADALEEKADASLNQDRKTNTARRASQATTAEAYANSDKALAKTMRNIAQAIDSGKAKLLDRVRQKVQVETLQKFVRNAQGDMLRALYPTYGEQQKHAEEAPTAETADYATFPSYTALRSDLAGLGRSLLEVDGTKKLGQQIMKSADDVSAAYLKFAKENLHKVDVFRTKDGGRAALPSKAAAEAAIARSDYRGMAIVLPFKRNENLIILSPSEAMKRGIWEGDHDKRITFTPEFGAELVEKVGKAARRGNKISVPWQFENAYDNLKRFAGMGIETPAELRAAMREFIGLREAAEKPSKVKQLERAMVGRKNDGFDFFPTSSSVADEAIAAAGIEEGMSVYEPQAGMGHIADRIREAGFEPDVGEIAIDRRELLEAKGYNLVSSDFMDMTLADTPDGKGYDRIIMNPPFSDRRDALHLQHAYSLLKPGGRVVSIMGEGVFFGSDKKADGFRNWFDEVGGTDEKLPEGSFLDPSLPVNTGVNARMVVIDKPTSGSQSLNDLKSKFSRTGQRTRFYSALSRAFEDAKQGSMPASQWNLWLTSSKAKLGLKQDEIAWSGIEEYLKLRGKDRVTKAEIADYLSGNGVVVSDVVKGGASEAEWSDAADSVNEAVRARLPEAEIDRLRVVRDDLRDKLDNQDETKFSGHWASSYPNGIEGTYREILVTLPSMPGKQAVPRKAIFDEYQQRLDALYKVAQSGYGSEAKDALAKYYTLMEERDAKANAVAGEAPNFKSPHWSEPNVLVHIRLDEVIGEDGKRYVRVGEIQSDWSAKGQKEGFEPTQEKEWVVRLKDGGSVYRRTTTAHEARSLAQGNPELEVVEGERTVPARIPSAPFVTDTRAYVALGIKRAISHAADVGADGVVFGTGQQNADLYSLDKQVDSISWFPPVMDRLTKDGSIRTVEIKIPGKNHPLALDLNSDGLVNRAGGPGFDGLEGKNVADVVGKEVAKKIMDEPSGKLEGEGLKLEATGMRNFYDVILPSVAKEVLKKVGGNVESIAAEGSQVGFQMTEAMRAKALGGLPLFKKGDTSRANGIDAAEAQAVVDSIPIKVRPKGGIVVVQESDDMPPHLGDLDGVQGAYDTETDTIYLVADNLDSAEEAAFVFAHELFGHHGMRKSIPGLDKTLNQIWLTNGSVRADAKRLMGQFDYDRLTAVEEVLADMAASGEAPQLKGWKKFLAQIIDWLNSLHTQTWTESDVLELVAGAGRYVREGGASVRGGKIGAAFSRKGQANPLPEETGLEKARRVGQDAFLRFKVIQEWLKEEGVSLSESADIYALENLGKATTANKLEDFRKFTVKLLIEKIAKAGFEIRDIVDYLEAVHIPEANARIRKIQKDPTATANGVDDATAKQVVADFAAKPKFAEFKKLAAEVRGMSDETLNMPLREGILSQEKYDAIKGTFTDYVPLRGDMSDKKQGFGKGISTSSKLKNRFGHDARDNEFIFENLVAARERAIFEVEHNKLGRALANFILEANNQDIGTIGQPVKQSVLKDHVYAVAYQGKPVASFETQQQAQAFILKTTSSRNGAVQGLKLDPSELSVKKSFDPHVIMMAKPQLAENEVQFYVKGHAIRIQLNDPLLARAATNAGIEQIVGVMYAMRQFNAFLSKAYTAWSPDFLFANPARDLHQSFAVISGKMGTKFTASALLKYPGSMRDLWKSRNDTRVSPWVTRYRAAGGNTGAAYMTDLERVGEDAMTAMHEFQTATQVYDSVFASKKAGGASDKKAKAFAIAATGASKLHKIPVVGHFVRLMTILNGVTENALRLAVFKQAIESGLSGQEAARLAKDLMNFNRKGEIANQAGALYLFLNPAVQGAHVFFEALTESKHKNQARAMAGGMIMVGFLLAELGRMGDDDDDDEEQEWRNLPDHIKSRNMVFKIFGIQITIPVSYGFGIFHSMGLALSDALHGVETSRVALDLTSSMFENFSVFGNPLVEEKGEIVFRPDQLLPTLPKMLIAPSTNIDSLGRNIAPIKYRTSAPDSQNMTRALRGSTYAEISAVLNDWTGGTKYTPGVIDVSPNVLKYWVTSLTGGAGRFAGDAVDGVKGGFDGVAPDLKNVPIARVFVRDQPLEDSRSGFWRVANKAQMAMEQYRAALKNDDQKAAEGIETDKSVYLKMARNAGNSADMAGEARNEVERIRNSNVSAREKKAEIELVEKREKEIYDRFLKLFNSGG